MISPSKNQQKRVVVRDALATNCEGFFSSIFKQLYAILCYYAFRITKNKSVAEDIVQNSFIKLWNRRQDFNKKDSSTCYLYKLTYFACIDWRKQSNVTSTELDEYDPEATDLNPEHRMIAAEVYRNIAIAMEKLPDCIANVITLIYLEGKSYKETAKILKKSINTVKKQRAKGIEILREESI